MPHRSLDLGWIVVALGLVLAATAPAASQQEVEARVELADQVSDGGALIVDQVRTTHGGFVAIYDTDPRQASANASILGVSGPRGAGLLHDVLVPLDQPIEEDRRVYAVIHHDSDGNQVFEHRQDPEKDPPYRVDGEIVADPANVTLLGQDQEEVPGWILPLAGGLVGALVGAGLAWWHRARVKKEP